MTRRGRDGVTLAELMVVIVMLGVMAGVTAVAFARREPSAAANPTLAAIAAARAESIGSGKAVLIRLESDGSLSLATAYPDGRVVTDAPVAIDPLTGRSGDAAR